MRPWPVQPRAGFTGFPNEVLARALGEFTPEQFRLFVGLAYGAEFRREGTVSPDGRWRIGWGQVLVSHDSLAKTYAISVDAVRRALHRFEQVGLATSARAASAAASASGAATPPTVVSFATWYGIRPALERTATSAATWGAATSTTPLAPIQQENMGNEAAAAACRRAAPELRAGPLGAAYVGRVENALGRGLAVPGPGPNAAHLWQELESLLEGRGGVERAVEWTVSNANRRPSKHRPGSVAWCVKLLRSLSPVAPAPAPRDVGCSEWARVLSRVRERLRADLADRWFEPLHGRMSDGVLVLEAPDAFTAEFVRDEYHAWITKAVREVLGADVHVEVACPHSPSAGAAT